MNHLNSTTTCTQKSSGDKKLFMRRDNVRTGRRVYDPEDRLVKAIALQAVKDLVAEKPIPPLSLLERETARMFIISHADLYHHIGISQAQLDALLASVPPILPQEVAA